VIAFAGESGAGKSTAAAAHLQEGWRLVADDLVAVDLRTAPPTVLTAYPQVKLWPDAAGALGLSVEGTERVHERHEKRILSLDRDRIARSRLSLNAVYVLSQGSSNLQRLEAQDALVEILRHSYAPRIMRVLERQAEHLGQCAALAAAAPISRLVIDRSHQGHSEVVALVERDLRADKPVAPGHSTP
jgi:hypothetical protein